MPTLVASAIAYAFTAGVVTQGVWVIAYAVTIAAVVTYSSYQSRKAGRAQRDAINASLEDRLVMTSQVDRARTRLYGKVRNVDGVLFKATRGVNSEFYTLVIGICGHEIAGIDEYWFADKRVQLDADGYVMTEPWLLGEVVSDRYEQHFPKGAFTLTLPHYPVSEASVSVTQPVGNSAEEYVEGVIQWSIVDNVITGVTDYPTVSTSSPVIVTYQWERQLPKARIKAYLGAPGQNLAPELQTRFGSTILNTDRFATGAVLLVDLEYHRDAFAAGLPSISVVARGAKILDPRSGVVAWSENPALCAYDWALYKYGGNIPADIVDVSSVIAAANACDIAHAYVTDGVTVVRPMFTCGMVAPTDKDPWVSMNEIIEAMAGKVGWPGGRLRMRAGVYTAPVAHMTQDWLSGVDKITIVAEPPLDQAINIVRPTIFDAANGYNPIPIAEIRAPAYIAADGFELVSETLLQAVTHSDQAQHICGVQMRDARNGLTAVFPCNLKAFQLEFLDVFTSTLSRFGFEAKTFETLGWRYSIRGGVVLTTKETTAEIFQPDAGFSASDITPNTNLPSAAGVGMNLREIASGTAQLVRRGDGTIESRILVTWYPVASAEVQTGGHVQLRYGLEGQAESQWQTIQVPGFDTQAYLTGVQDRYRYVIKARAFNGLRYGVWSEQMYHSVVGKTEPPANVTGFVVTIGTSGLMFSWDQNLEADYLETEVRIGTSWTAFTNYFIVSGSSIAWTAPPVGSYTAFVKHRDTSRNESSTAASFAFVVTAQAALAWSSLVDRPKMFRAVAHGYNVPTPVAPGLINAETGVHYAGNVRSYNLAVIQRSTGVVIQQAGYDVFNQGATTPGRDAAALAAALNALGNDVVVVLISDDEPSGFRLTGGLLEAMLRCGASRAVFGSPNFRVRSAYCLVGIGACGEGNGFESYQGSFDGDPAALVDIAFQIQFGQLLVTGLGATPRTLADYSYVGDLNATNGAQFGINISGQAIWSDIAPGAVCDVLPLAVVGPLDITNVVEVARINVGPYPFDCKLLVTATFSIAVTPSSGGAIQRAWGDYIFQSFFGGVGPTYESPIITDLTPASFGCTMSGTFDYFTSTLSWVALIASGRGSISAASIRDIRMRVEVIKR